MLVGGLMSCPGDGDVNGQPTSWDKSHETREMMLLPVYFRKNKGI